ncbi:MAG: TIGR02996 domain-containing protein [Planctomycetes bacterium]|nr:TIGR02996 domain-containing protein [Planctomycetota bacterium]
MARVSPKPLPAPRPELLALLDAVKDNPDDDTPRLVLADWLDEQDEPLDAERAAFIRKDIAANREHGFLQSLPPTGEALNAEEVRFKRWLGPIGNFTTGRFHRGLPTAWFSAPDLLKPDCQRLLPSEEFAFVQFVRLTDASGPRMEMLAKQPEFRFMPAVSLDPFNSFGTHYAIRFFESPNLTGLRHIAFRGVDPGAAGVETLAKNPALSRLRKLTLFHNKLVDKAAIALAAAKHLKNLTYLDLRDNKIGDKGAESLAASNAFPNLSCLVMRENSRITDAGKKQLRDKFGDRVRLD